MPSPSHFVFASGNSHKAQEMAAIARACGTAISIVSAAEHGGMPAVEEDAGSFAGNARKKAAALKAQLPPGAWVLADDSGLCVDALEGAPGVESAYFAGRSATAAENLARLVERMRGIPEHGRGAHFVCVLLLMGPDGLEKVFEGRCGGKLRQAPAGAGGFGYDPLFQPSGEELTFAELGAERKNQISHRARAWKELAAWLAEVRL